jgi:hypothetical protein
MNLDRVTFTGADDSTQVSDMLRLSRSFPFIEWGILVSESAHRDGGRPRYPSPRWIADLQAIAEQTGAMQLSLHVCGRWVRDLLIGTISLPTEFLHCFQRVQLNFHAERTECRPQEFAKALKLLAGKDFIFQLDGAKGNAHLDSAYEWEVKRCFPLFDVSGGAGIVPAAWPAPIYIDVVPGESGCGEESHSYHGYAGGLGPHNLASELTRIETAADGAPIWIDMETHVRSDDDQLFDLEKVRQCIDICEPLIARRAAIAQ